MREHVIIRQITDLGPGDHLCCIYSTEEEHRALLTPYLRQGLERNQKVLYIVDARTAEEILGYLADDGLEVELYLSSGQLAILTSDEAYMKEGTFDPEGMIRLLTEETELALSEGYSALRVTGEMTWALRGLPGSERLMEYEAKLNHFFPGSACLAICQYDRRRFPPEMLLDVLTTHPTAVIGTQIYENFYYIHPDEYLSNRLPQSTLEHWIGNLEERKASSEALRESEEKFRSIVEQSSDGIVLVNREGMVVEWNLAQEKITGVGREEALGRFLWDLQYEVTLEERKTPRAYQHLKGMIQESLSAGYADWMGEPREAEIRTPHGRRRFIQSIAFPLHTREGFMVGSVTRDITEHVDSESALKRYSRDLEERVKELNCLYGIARIVELPEITLEEMLQRIAEVIPPAWKYSEIACARLVLGEQEFKSCDYKASPWIQTSDFFVRGKKEGTVEVYYLEERPDAGEGPFLKEERDLLEAIAERLGRIIERKRAEEELKRINSELETYAYVVSHDLRGPISSIISASGTLDELMRDCRDEEAAEQVMEVASIVLRSALSAVDLINNLLGLAKAGQVPKEISLVDVKENVDRVLAEKATLIEARKTKVILDDDLGRIMADPTHIYQLFANLIANAIEYNDNPVPEIGITYREEDGAHHYRVRDNGSGISPGNAEKVFLPLFRGRRGGTGLGLTIVKRIVEVYGGHIEVQNDGGTCFDFTIKDFSQEL